ncbi:DUF2786 domain-containing protein [Holdemania massiliensis]|uniref:DUF2786 domain-containing protein n=1 Tax=Holdemania massiliensis TaxID=1468449 RepID=UPI002430F18E|nr:DUF2786 domain-containing protein [Holdemania massiliensis]
MNEKLEQVKVRIKKLMAIANDPNSSENEVFQATKMSQKLMVKYHIEMKDVVDLADEKIDSIVVGTYPSHMARLFHTLADNFRLDSYFCQSYKICIFKACGLNSDLEMGIPVIKKILDYALKESEVWAKRYKKYSPEELFFLYGELKKDVRIVKRSFMDGFRRRIKEKFDENLIEMRREYGSTSLMVIGIPEVVENYVAENLHVKKVTKKYEEGSTWGYQHGELSADRYGEVR